MGFLEYSNSPIENKLKSNACVQGDIWRCFEVLKNEYPDGYIFEDCKPMKTENYTYYQHSDMPSTLLVDSQTETLNKIRVKEVEGAVKIELLTTHKCELRSLSCGPGIDDLSDITKNLEHRGLRAHKNRHDDILGGLHGIEDIKEVFLANNFQEIVSVNKVKKLIVSKDYNNGRLHICMDIIKQLPQIYLEIEFVTAGIDMSDDQSESELASSINSISKQMDLRKGAPYPNIILGLDKK